MSMPTLHKRPMILAGDFFFKNPPSATSFIGPLETTEIVVTINTDTVEQQSFSRDTWGAVRSSVVLPGSTEVQITFQDITPDMMAMVLMGQMSSQSLTAGSVTDENVTAELGYWVPLTKRNITSGTVVVTDSAGATTYVENVDYAIEYVTGMLMALPGGAITDGQALKVDYSHGANTIKKIDASNQSQIRIFGTLVGVNLADPSQRRLVATFPQLSLRPSEDIPLKGEEYITTTLTGVAELASGYNGVFTLEYFDES